MNTDIFDIVVIKTTEHGLKLSDEALGLLRTHVELVRSWNDYVHLVSKADLEMLADRHVLDSLSLVPIIEELETGSGGRLLDIGSGAGFPAIPLKAAMPGLVVRMIERKERKASFLTKAIADLELDETEAIRGSFPKDAGDFSPSVITARAVESPDKLRESILGWMPLGCTFLCQSGDPGPLDSESLSVRKIEDSWGLDGSRRGEVYAITKRI